MLNHKYENPSFCLLGDFNSRTADRVETSFDDNDNFLPFEDVFSEPLFVPSRRSQDKTLNIEGKKLLDLCRVSRLIMMNGISEDDFQGELTYISTLGSSVIDYALVSERLFYSTVAINFVALDSMTTKHKPILLSLSSPVGRCQTPSADQRKHSVLPRAIVKDGDSEILDQRFETYVRPIWDNIRSDTQGVNDNSALPFQLVTGLQNMYHLQALCLKVVAAEIVTL